MRKVNYLLTILSFKVAKESHKEHLVSSSYQITLYYQSTNHFSGKKQRQNFTEDHLQNSAANLMTMIFSKEVPTDYVALCQGLSRIKFYSKESLSLQREDQLPKQHHQTLGHQVLRATSLGHCNTTSSHMLSQILDSTISANAGGGENGKIQSVHHNCSFS